MYLKAFSPCMMALLWMLRLLPLSSALALCLPTRSLVHDLVWKTHHLEAGAATTATLVLSESVMELPGFICEQDCEAIVNGARTAIDSTMEEVSNTAFLKSGLARIPLVAAAERAKAKSTPCANPVDDATDGIARKVLAEVAEALDANFPDLVHSLFSDAPNSGKTMGHSRVSLLDLFRLDKLQYASREPTINWYREGGKFHAHTDGQQLTVLIPLTDDFDGGGTAFWSESQRHRLDPPAVVITPPRGTVLLFGGQVTHAGLPVQSGERVVLVASFSRRE